MYDDTDCETIYEVLREMLKNVQHTPNSPHSIVRQVTLTGMKESKASMAIIMRCC